MKLLGKVNFLSLSHNLVHKTEEKTKKKCQKIFLSAIDEFTWNSTITLTPLGNFYNSYY